MAPYIFGKRNLIHIIDLRETIRGMVLASRFLSQTALRGETVLFVGTKRQAQVAIEKEAKRAGCPYVAERWLGGCLTNYRTVHSRLGRLLELERIEETGEINAYSKKMIASLRREKRKMLRNLDGLRTLDHLPGALVIIDPRHEHIAVQEALKLDIPVVALLDTDSDPDKVTLPVPGNDDAIRSIEIFLRYMADAVMAGREDRLALPPEQRERPAAPRREAPARPSTDRGRGQQARGGGRGRGGGGRGPGRGSRSRDAAARIEGMERNRPPGSKAPPRREGPRKKQDADAGDQPKKADAAPEKAATPAPDAAAPKPDVRPAPEPQAPPAEAKAPAQPDTNTAAPAAEDTKQE